MRAVDLIRSKRDGAELSREQIGYLVRSYCIGAIPDYQAAAFLMSVFFRGMSDSEMAALTEEMRASGTTLDLSALPGRKVDKHSTGGVGDKTSLVIAPALAAAGLIVPMISGRGLAHTGGTLDKLESIPGFEVSLSEDRFLRVLSEVGVAMAGQSEHLVPADRKLYALRDVTATVDSPPLIAASIMSKKLAEGIDALVLDVKTGSGAFMKEHADAEGLARAMVGIGRSFGKRVAALVTDMSQPLGRYVGNSLEIIEAIQVLRGAGPDDTCRLCEELAAHCLVLGEVASTLDEARSIYSETIRSGRALDRFRSMIRAQGGRVAAIDDTRLLPRARGLEEVPSPESGFVSGMDTEGLGLAMSVLGAGRDALDSRVDLSVGMFVHKKIGDFVEKREPLVTIHYNDAGRCGDARDRVMRSYQFSGTPTVVPELIRTVLTDRGA